MCRSRGVRYRASAGAAAVLAARPAHPVHCAARRCRSRAIDCTQPWQAVRCGASARSPSLPSMRALATPSPGALATRCRAQHQAACLAQPLCRRRARTAVSMHARTHMHNNTQPRAVELSTTQRRAVRAHVRRREHTPELRPRTSVHAATMEHSRASHPRRTQSWSLLPQPLRAGPPRTLPRATPTRYRRLPHTTHYTHTRAHTCTRMCQYSATTHARAPPRVHAVRAGARMTARHKDAP